MRLQRDGIRKRGRGRGRGDRCGVRVCVGGSAGRRFPGVRVVRLLLFARPVCCVVRVSRSMCVVFGMWGVCVVCVGGVGRLRVLRVGGEGARGRMASGTHAPTQEQRDGGEERGWGRNPATRGGASDHRKAEHRGLWRWMRSPESSQPVPFASHRKDPCRRNGSHDGCGGAHVRIFLVLVVRGPVQRRFLKSSPASASVVLLRASSSLCFLRPSLAPSLSLASGRAVAQLARQIEERSSSVPLTKSTPWRSSSNRRR